MTTELDAVLAQALKLTPDERAELIETLADTVLPAPSLHPDWEAEIARRVAEMDAGRTRFIPMDEAMAAPAARINHTGDPA
ncbi:MAG: addiction module protein [Ideonella sp.]|nr:addiction module protein [Ideonella sp.]